MYRVESAIESQGLDICAGNLHALNYGKSALVFDLMEEFRTPIADSICCNLFNMGTLKEEDFDFVNFSVDDSDYPLEQNNNIPDTTVDSEDFEKAKKGVLLTKQGIKKVISAFESKLDSLIFYSPMNQKISYAKIIYEQVIHYKRVILGEEKEYRAYYFK